MAPCRSPSSGHPSAHADPAEVTASARNATKTGSVVARRPTRGPTAFDPISGASRAAGQVGWEAVFFERFCFLAVSSEKNVQRGGGKRAHTAPPYRRANADAS